MSWILKLRWCVLAVLVAGPARADLRSTLAREAAEAVVARFGAKAAQGGVSTLARRIESYAVSHGDEVFKAVRRVGPGAFGMIDSAGVNGARAVRVLAEHGEAGAVAVLRRPAAMRAYLAHGEQAAATLVKHPGVAERVIERGGVSGVNAMAAVGPQNGRRVAMLMDGSLGKSPRAVELLDVIAKYGDRGAAFVWDNKGALATAAGLTAFLANPEAFISGGQALGKVAGETTVGVAQAAGKHVVAPVVGGVFTALNIVLGLVAVVIVAAAALAWKYGVPRPETIKSATDVIRGK
jgi:hypothetical protein